MRHCDPAHQAKGNTGLDRSYPLKESFSVIQETHIIFFYLHEILFYFFIISFIYLFLQTLPLTLRAGMEGVNRTH